jgi:hypothetical protein
MPLRTFTRSLACTLAFVIALASSAVWSETKPAFVDIPNFATAIDQSLAQGVLSANQTLSRLGADVQQALADAQNKTDFDYQFSARTNVRMLYQRAELQKPGQGNLFLSRLRNSLAKTSAAIAEDPRLKYLERIDANPEQPIVFASIDKITPEIRKTPLPPEVDAAVDVLSEHVASTGIGNARRIFLRNLNLNGSAAAESQPNLNGLAAAESQNVGTNEALRKMDSIISSSKSRRLAIGAIVGAHTPPPSVQFAMRRVIADFAALSGAFAVDPAVARVISGLSVELTATEKGLVESESASSTADAESAELARHRARSPSGIDTVSSFARAIENTGDDASAGVLSFPEWQVPEEQRLAKMHEGYIQRSFEKRTADATTAQSPPPTSPPANDGIGNTANGSPTPGNGGGGSFTSPVPRKYSDAIKSPRAARGIAIGAEMKNAVDRRPLKAFWVSDPANDRFGRFVVSFAPCRENWLEVVLGAVEAVQWSSHGDDLRSHSC